MVTLRKKVTLTVLCKTTNNQGSSERVKRLSDWEEKKIFKIE